MCGVRTGVDVCQTRRVASLTAKNHLLILSSFIKFKRLESEVRIKSEHVTFHICDVLDEMCCLGRACRRWET